MHMAKFEFPFPWICQGSTHKWVGKLQPEKDKLLYTASGRNPRWPSKQWYCWWFRNRAITTWDVKKPCKYWGKLPTSTGEPDFWPATVVLDLGTFFRDAQTFLPEFKKDLLTYETNGLDSCIFFRSLPWDSSPWFTTIEGRIFLGNFSLGIWRSKSKWIQSPGGQAHCCSFSSQFLWRSQLRSQCGESCTTCWRETWRLRVISQKKWLP